MDLTQLANVGEFIGGLAVLVTLIYLAVQLKQGRTELSSSRHHEMLDFLWSHNLSPVSENREYAEFILLAQQSPGELDETDWYRFVLYAYGVYAMWEDAYISHQRGLTDIEEWTAWDKGMRFAFAGPGYRRFWEELGPTHSPMFRRYVDTEVFITE